MHKHHHHFLFSVPLVKILLLSSSRIILSILQGGSTKEFIPLMRLLQEKLVSRNFLVRLLYSFYNFFFYFISTLMVSTSKIPKCLLSFLYFERSEGFFYDFGNFNVSIICRSHYYHSTNAIPISSLYVLIVCISL